MKRILLLPLLVGAAAYGLPTAHIALPPGWQAQVERIPTTGFGGSNKGTFRLAGFHGEFVRGESRLALFDAAYVSNRGKSSFTLRDDDSTEVVSAECDMRRKVVTIDIVTFDPKKMAYYCEFRRGGELLGARLAIGHPKTNGFKEAFLAMDRRRGESNLFGQHLLIDSVHAYEGSKVQSSAPIGYRLTHGERTVAALELTDWNPTVFVAADVTGDLRQGVIATVLALAVLRDPADSPLED